MSDASVTDRHPWGSRLEGEEETVMTHRKKKRKQLESPFLRCVAPKGTAEAFAWKARQHVEKITRLSSKDVGCGAPFSLMWMIPWGC